VNGDDLMHTAVASIYDAATDPDRWPLALQAIADVTADVGTVLMWRRGDGGFGTIVSPALEKAQADYAALWWRRDIRAFRGAELAYAFPEDGVTDRDIVTEDEIRDHPIYTDFLVPHGLGWFAAANVAPDPKVYVVISVQRRHDRPWFTGDEVHLVSKLGRHVEQSLRLSMRLIDAEVSRDGLAAALAAMKIGLFGLDSLGRITHLNAAGRALLGNGLSVENDRLAPRDRAAHTEFEEKFEAARGDLATTGPKTMILKTGDGADPLLLHFLPVSGRDAIDDAFLAATRVLVLVSRIGRNEPVDPTILRDLMGLTLAEARVATLVGSGLAPKTAAGRLGITEETTRTVLKRVFSKTGVSRQSELVALLAGLVIR
jgi:DNA-binding CsgD family transcriptional regulator/PAS domain-containing protein